MNIQEFERFQTGAIAKGVIYYFQGDLSSSVIAAIGEVLRFRLDEEGVKGPVKRKLFSTFVEMAQNILHYGASTQAETARDGITHKKGAIALGSEGNDYWVVCGNLIEVEHIPRITEKLGDLQKLSAEEIRAQYKKQLVNDEHSEQDTISKGAGLGLLTIARDSKAPIEFSFASDSNSNGRFAYFIIKAII